MRPKIAVVGRQNVGKSTLINRLHGRREAIADEMPGVTRDRLDVNAMWRGRTFTLIDTGGYVRDAEGIEALVSEQADRASASADIIMLVCDAATGPQEEDIDLAKRLRSAKAPVILVANKVDSERDLADAATLHRLGLGEPVAVSALHGRGTGDLLDRIVDLLPDSDSIVPPREPRFALVGRPNVGKSSLFNRLVGEQRSVVFPEAGTTRDAIDEVVALEGVQVRFVDTAGLRPQVKTTGVEYYGLLRTMRAIERCDVAILVLDASEGFTNEDKRIANSVIEAGRGLVVAANKWDLVDEKDKLFKDFTVELGAYAHATLLRTVATRGSGVNRIAPAILSTRERWLLRVSTSQVNRIIEAAQAERPAPRDVGRFKYATQAGTAPPTFILFGGNQPTAGYRRFLERRIRETFGFQGVPLRLRFKPKDRERKADKD